MRSQFPARTAKWHAYAWLLSMILILMPVGGYSLEEQAKTPSNNANIKKVAADVVGGKIVGGSYPASNYAILLPSTRETVSITPTAEDPNATIKINGVSKPSGQASEPIHLVHGINLVDIVITAEDGKTQNQYEFKAIRAYPTPNWVRVAEHAPWVERDSAGEIVFKDRMWIFGGYIPELISDVWSTTDGKTWEQGTDIPDKDGINVPVAFAYSGKMWITSNAGRLYSSEDGKTWTKVLDKVPFGQGVGVIFKDKMWVVGGVDGRQTYSSTDGVNWKLEQAAAPWSKRSLFGNVVAHAGKMWVVGGSFGQYQPFRGYRDVWNSEDGVNWTQVTDEAPWAGRRWGSAMVYRNRIWLIGGFRGQPTWQNFNDPWYSTDGKDWKQLQTEDIWSQRHEISTYVHDDKLWVIAGNAWPLVNDSWNLHIPGMVFISQPVVEEYTGALYRYHAQADFNDSLKPISYRLIKSPKWLSIDSKTGVATGTPTDARESEVVIEAYDEAGETARQTYTLRVISS